MHAMARMAVVILLTVATPGCTGLRQRDPRYSTIAINPHRNTEQAISQTQRAVKLIKKGKLDKAEQVLQKALTSDVTYGPAHNNLGQL